MIVENVHSLILQKKANGLAFVELYGPEGKRKLKHGKSPLLARFPHLTDVTLKNVKEAETIMVSDDIEITFQGPVTCVAEKDEVYSNMATTRPALAGIYPMGLTCKFPEW